jgi:hypothetical protein
VDPPWQERRTRHSCRSIQSAKLTPRSLSVSSLSVDAVPTSSVRSGLSQRDYTNQNLSQHLVDHSRVSLMFTIYSVCLCFADLVQIHSRMFMSPASDSRWTLTCRRVSFTLSTSSSVSLPFSLALGHCVPRPQELALTLGRVLSGMRVPAPTTRLSPMESRRV